MSDPLGQLATWCEVTDSATEGPWVAEYSAEQGDCVIPHDAQSTREAVATTRLYRRASDAEFIAASRTAMPALLDAVEAVLELHSHFRIYGECECIDTDTEGHVEVWDVGSTCNYLYSVCRECCTCGPSYQREDCESYHNHAAPGWECPTVTAITAALEAGPR